MKLEEFLRWDDGTDTRYELVRGKVRPLGIAPATHSALLARLGARIHDAVKPRPEYVALLTSALTIPGREDTCYLADIVVAPTPARWGDMIISDPVLAIEVVSPETYRHDMLVKRPDYMSIRSLKEIVCVDSNSVFAEVFRRGPHERGAADVDHLHRGGHHVLALRHGGEGVEARVEHLRHADVGLLRGEGVRGGESAGVGQGVEER